MYVDVLTGGNHTLQKPEILPMLEAERRTLRPANIAAKAPGRGVTTVETPAGPVSVVNIMGSASPTAAHRCSAIIDDLVAEARRGADVVLVDVHAEATSEKIALAHHLDGRVPLSSAPHDVQTADAGVGGRHRVRHRPGDDRPARLGDRPHRDDPAPLHHGIDARPVRAGRGGAGAGARRWARGGRATAIRTFSVEG